MSKNLITKIYNQSPFWIQNLLVSTYGAYLYKKRYRGLYKDIYEQLQTLTSMNVKAINAIQEEALNAMVNHCFKNIPYYQRLFSEISIVPSQITSVADLKKLPILEKQTLRQNVHLFRSRVSDNAYMTQKTSGSTGTPLELKINEYTYKLAMALLVNHEEKHGVAFGAPRATFAGRLIQPLDNTKPPYSRFNWAENQRIFSSYHLNKDTFPEYKKELNAFQPEEIIGYPSAISDLANHYFITGSSPEFQPKAIITNSETLLAWQRVQIESIFKCPVYDYYGTAEYVIFAGQTDEKFYKTNPLIGISELVKQNENDIYGRLISTTLTNTTMPLLRYDLGDLAEPVNIKDQAPGTLTLRQIVGRNDDYILTEDGRRIGRIDHIFKGVKGVREAQVIQDAKSHCTIQIVLADRKIFDEYLVLNNFLERVGTKMKLDFAYVDDIPRGANGKFKSVVSLLK